MIYPVIILLTVICTIVTLFLTKESFRSERKKFFTFSTLITTCVTIIAFIGTMVYSFQENKYQENEYQLEEKIRILQKEIEYLKEELNSAQNQLFQLGNENNIAFDNSNKTDTQIDNKPIVFNNIPCLSLSKNHEDTELKNSGAEFIFYNHPEDNNTYNTATFSFDLEKYNSFNIGININDNITNKNEIQTTIGFYNEIGEILIEEKLNNNNPSSHIYIDISNLSTLTIIIKTNMIETDDALFRTVSFSDINIQ